MVVTQYEPYDIENKEYTPQSFAEEYHLEDYQKNVEIVKQLQYH